MTSTANAEQLKIWNDETEFRRNLRQSHNLSNGARSLMPAG